MNIKGLTTFNLKVDSRYSPNEYLYNGKIFQDELGLDWLDYGARFYDAQLGRWHSPDPLEQYESGYVYVGNNPISMNDPSGMWAERIHDKLSSSYIDRYGKVLWHKDDGDNRVYLVTNTSSWVKGGMKKEGLRVVGYEDPSRNYRRGDHYDFYVPPSLLNAYRFYSMFENAINYWSDFLGGPEGEEVSALDKLNYQIMIYATGKFLVVTSRGINPSKRKLKIPDGFREVKGVSSKGQPVLRKGRIYITPDIDSHKGGAWKMADSPKNLGSKTTRMGTYNEDLTNKVGN